MKQLLYKQHGLALTGTLAVLSESAGQIRA